MTERVEFKTSRPATIPTEQWQTWADELRERMLAGGHDPVACAEDVRTAVGDITFRDDRHERGVTTDQPGGRGTALTGPRRHRPQRSTSTVSRSTWNRRRSDRTTMSPTSQWTRRRRRERSRARPIARPTPSRHQGCGPGPDRTRRLRPSSSSTLARCRAAGAARERRARVRCSNGWATWVDGRTLV